MKSEKAGNRKANIKNRASDGIDVEFSEQSADHDDLEAIARMKAADRRAKRK
ncbi:YfhD family protein [Bacillus sp. FJAT-50079]|uniref:YfhD family protein n=1 Tax=Bacillus sp. FJAT-50079 TaxID=2833577 RepID=UPI001BCA22D7|nr:YfhD family protein [Bacillus sp. FJAT-50079]MBS4209134.1 YfhD family protein [Bacillus sp. FJAT-50079]